MEKVYDAKALFDVAKDRENAYDELLSQLGELKKALQGVADLEGSLEGKGADNIKSFYKQHADTAGQWENLIKMQKSYFSALHVKAEKAKLAGSTVVNESFLETELKNANSNAKEMVAQQHEDLQSILNGIDDIVSISAFSTSEFNDKIEEAEKKRTDTIEAVNQLDAEWSKEYSEMDDFYTVVNTLVSGLELATSQGGSAYQLAFNEKAYHDSELYKVQTKLNDYATSYVDYNKQQEEVYELEKKQEEEANKPWYEKTWDAVSTFTGEVSGYYDYKRAAEGVDPVTGEKLSTSQRVAAGAMAAAGFIPVVGWVGRAAKGGKAIYKTAKGLSAADHALDAYKSAKSFKVLQQTEKGLYGLVAANGLGEYMTGRDMFGNKISEEQRKASLLQALGIAGAGALSTKVAGKTAKAGANAVANGAKKLSDMRNSLRTEVITNRARSAYQSVQKSSPSWTQSLKKTYNNILDSNMPRLMPELAPLGPDLSQRTVRETLQNSKNYVMQKAEKVSVVSKGTGKGLHKLELGNPDLENLRKKWSVPETHTIAVGKTDIKGLKDLTFEGGSPEVRREAGLPSLDEILPDREIRAPYDHLKNPKLAQFTRHAEEGVLNEFDSGIKKAGIEPNDVTGTLRIHQSNPRGVCNKCSKGLLKPYPIEKSGIFYQASKKYPNLTIIVTSEIDNSVKANGLLSFVLKDGKIIK
ncbi:ribonuclease YeeF family protein [Priestia megaterium]|uniref:ribonuclease YeeF family protein n=1 Tax=Priestia megaterium TaxID=1404 RepID=UPI0028648A7E|nr:T7SS effector LXG polymorphic toxin [Priestia megaterium]MDR7241859.1 putative ribonuclease toxin of YeeF-YezG toxin-antitoxin module [Priestia megaterium]